jgi:hypothetical protein
MNNKYLFSFIKEIKGQEEDAEPTKLTCVVNLNYLVNSIYDGKVLYLFMDEQVEAVKIVPVPVKRKVTKDNPNEWAHENQARTLKESFTLEVTDEEAITRFLDFSKEVGI